MASYIPWYGKKRQRLKQVEDEFIELLHQARDRSALAQAADKLRAAHIRALKARRDYLAPCEKNATAFQNRDREIEQWTNLPVEVIIERYRERPRA
jgi:hypothetical protein